MANNSYENYLNTMKKEYGVQYPSRPYTSQQPSGNGFESNSAGTKKASAYENYLGNMSRKYGVQYGREPVRSVYIPTQDEMNVRQFVSDYGDWYNRSASGLEGMDWQSGYNASTALDSDIAGFAEREKGIRDWLETNRDTIDPEYYASVTQYLDNIAGYNQELLTAYAGNQDYFRQWESQEDYERYQYLSGMDTKAFLEQIEQKEQELADLNKRYGGKVGAGIMLANQNFMPGRYFNYTQQVDALEKEIRTMRGDLKDATVLQNQQRENDWTMKYAGMRYDDLTPIIDSMEDGAEKDWLTGYAGSTMTAQDRTEKKAQNNTDIYYLDKFLEEWEALLDREYYLNSSGEWSEDSQAQIDGEKEALLARYGVSSLEDAQSRREALMAENWNLDKQNQYGSVGQAADFAEKSTVPTDYQGYTGSQVSKFDFINDINGARERETVNAAGYGGTSPYASLAYMEDDEIAVYNYLYNTDGTQAAEDYLEYLSYTLSARRMEDITAGSAELAEKGGIIADLVSVPTSLMSGLGIIDVGLQHLGRALGGEYAPIDYNRPGMEFNAMTRGIRNTRAQHFNQMGTINLDETEHPVLARILNGHGWGDVYQLGMSMLDSVASGRLSGVIGKAGTLLLSGSAATQGMLDALEKGATDEQALGMGILNGLTEWFFEAYEVENLLGMDTSYTKALLNQGLTEAFGEGMTTIANTFADFLVMAENSGLEGKVRDYMLMGYSREEAMKQALLDTAVEVGWDFAGGLLSGGIMGTAHQAIVNISTDSQTKANSKRLQELGETKFNADQKAAELAQLRGQYGDQGEYFERNYNPGQDVMEYDLEFQIAYEMGKAGADKSRLRSGSFRTMTESQRDIAYDAGVEARRNMANREKPGIERSYETSESGKTVTQSTGEEITIQGFSKVGSEAKLDIGGGKSVSLSEVLYANAEEAALYETVAQVAGSARSANIMIEKANSSGMNKADYAAGLWEAYEAGMTGSAAKSDIAEMEFAGKIENGVRSVVYDRGARQGQYRAARSEAVIKAKGYQRKGERKAGELHFDRKGRTFDSVKESSLKAMESISRALGIQIYVFESYERNGKRLYKDASGKEVKAPNGFYDPGDGSIHIDLNAGNTGKGTMMFTLAHELTHYIRQWSPVKFRVLTDVVLKGYAQKGQSVSALVDRQIIKAEANGRKLTREQALEEVVADSMEAMLVSGDFASVMAQMQQRDRNLWQKIRDWFDDVAQKLKDAANAYRSAAPDSAEGRMVQQMDEILEEIQRAFAEGLVEASGNMAAAEGQKNTTREGGEKMQERNTPYDYSKPFAQQIDDWLKQDGTFPQNDTLLVGKTPKVLRDIGVPALPVTIAQKNLKENLLGQYKGTPEEIADHAISPADMKSLPEKLANPVAIIADRRLVRNKWTVSESAIDVLVEMKINGKDTLVPVQITGTAKQHGMTIDSNAISSIHGNKDTMQRLWYAVTNDTNENIMVFYADKDKTTAYLRTAGYPITSGPNISDGVNHSITDTGSPVKLRVTSQIETRQFKNWFGNSKIVNADGSPKVMYHGSQAQFDTFDRKKAKSSGTYGKGFYFTDSTSHAGTYGNLYSVYLSIQNPVQAGKSNVTRSQVRAFLEAVADNEDYSIENYGTYDVDDILRNIMGSRSKIDAFRVIQDISGTAIGNMVEAVELFNDINGTDFDGIVTAMETVAFQPTQIKSATDNVGTFDKENPNIYYSDRDPTAAATMAELEKENAALRGDVEQLKELLRLQGTVTGGRIPKKSSVDAASRWLRSYAGATLDGEDMKTLSGMLTDFYSFVANEEELTWEGMMEQAEPIAEFLQKNVNIKPQMSDYAKDVLRELKGRRIALNDSQKAEVTRAYGSYNDYRKAAFGSVTLASDGLPLDSVWHEMASMFPGTFDEDVNAGDQPMALLDVVAGLRSTDTDQMEYAYNREFIKADIMQAVYDSYWRIDALKTVADRNQKQINELRAKHRQQMDDLRENKNRAIERVKKQRAEDIARIRKEMRQEIRDRVTATEKRYQESRAKATDSRKRTAVRNRIKKTVQEISRLYTNGTKERNVKKGMRGFVEQALATAEVLWTENYTDEDLVLAGIGTDMTEGERRLLDRTQELIRQRNDIFKGGQAEQAGESANVGDTEKMDALTKEYERLNKAIQANMRTLHDVLARERSRLNGTTVGAMLEGLAKAYKELGRSDDNFIRSGIYESVYQNLKNLIEDIGGTTVQDMTVDQLLAVENAYRSVLHTIREANKSFTNERNGTIAEQGENAAVEVKAAGGFKEDRVTALDPVRKFLWNNLKPIYAMQRIGSKTLTDAFNAIRKGEDTWARDVADARAYFLEVGNRYGYDSWDQEKTFTFKTPSGKEFRLNLGQMMSIYAYSKRTDAKDHLRIGGIVFDSNDAVYSTGDKKKGLKRSINDATAYQIGEGTVAQILSTLTQEQVQFVDDMQRYLSDTMGEKGNEISRRLYGIDLFTDKNYFPMKSARQFLFEQSQPAGEVSLKNSGFTKQIQPGASNPLVLGSFMNVWSQHVNQMSTYHGFALPIEDFNRIFNYQTPRDIERAPVSVKAAIQGAYTPAAVQYISNMLKDVNGGARSDPAAGVIGKMMSLFKKGAVFASLSVVVQQPSAIGRAAALIDPRYFAGNRVNPQKHEKSWAECKKYAPVAIIKEMGFFDTSVGKSTQDYITAKRYGSLKERIVGFVTDGGYRDEVLGKLPAMADEITWAAIWEAVKREQAALDRQADVKSEAFLEKCGERFTEVITKTQVYDSVLSRSANMRSKDTGMQMMTAFMAEPTTSVNMLSDAIVQYKRGRKDHARRAVGAVVAAQIINSVLVSLVYAARDDDENQTFLEKYMKALADNIWNDVVLMVPNSIPLISDVMSLLQGYDVERSDIAVISDFLKAFKKLENDKLTPLQKVEAFSGALAQLFGFPLKNILRDLWAVYNVGYGILNGEKTTAAGIRHAVTEGLTGSGVSDGKQLYAARMEGDESHAARIAARYETAESADSAVRNAIKESFKNGEIDRFEAEQHLFLYGGIDIHEAWWTVDAWVYEKDKGSADGYGKYNDIYAAVLNGDDITELMAEFTDHGYREDEVLSNIKREVGKWYYDDESKTRIGRDQAQSILENYFGLDEDEVADQLRSWDMKVETGFSYQDLKGEYLEGNVDRAQALDLLQRYGLLHKTEAEERLADWDFENEYGFSYDDIRNTYLDGDITAAEARKIMIEEAGKDPEDADKSIQLWDFEKENGWRYEDRVKLYKQGRITADQLMEAIMEIGGYTQENARAQIEVYDWETQGYEDVTVKRVQKWHEYCEGLGISKETFLNIQRFSAATKNDVDENGKTINYSAMKKVMAEIDSLLLTDDQKDALARSLGWSEKNIRKYKPW